jgi:hypothetical protein
MNSSIDASSLAVLVSRTLPALPERLVLALVGGSAGHADTSIAPFGPSTLTPCALCRSALPASSGGVEVGRRLAGGGKFQLLAQNASRHYGHPV